MTVAVVSRRAGALVVSPRIGLLPEMKTLGATWDRKDSTWRLPAAEMHVAAIRDLLGDDVEWEAAPDAPEPTVVVDDARLYDWQRRVASRLASAPRGQILVATPGLGKTAMAIAAADARFPGEQVLVVAPAPLLKTWVREIGKWGTGDASTFIVHGGEPDWEAVRAARWLVTSWDVVALHQDWFMGDWPLVVLDESVMAKSRKSQRSMMMRGGTRRGRKRADGTKAPDKHWSNLRRGVGSIWLLSGSPTTRYADDLWAQLNMIWPQAFPSYWRFAQRYCMIEPNDWAPGPGVVVATRRDRDAVRDNSDLITVVSQEDVLDLPEYLPEAVDVDLSPKQRKAYDEMEREFIAALDSGELVVSENRAGQMTRLLQIASFWEGSSSKHDALVSLLDGGAYEAPLLVWTHWRAGAEALVPRLEKVGLRTGHAYGGQSARVNDTVIEDYKAGRLDALVLSLGTGKYGHTLTNSRTIASIDKTFNADDYYQSLRRVRRIGLTWRPVLATFRAPGTMDELVEMNLSGKVEGISRITSANLRELILGLGR